MTVYHQVLNQLEKLQLSQELMGREQEKLKKQLKKAHLPYTKRLMDFDFQFQPKLNKTEIVDLHTLRFLDNKDNVLFIGNSDVGKIHLAISLTLEALNRGLIAYFILSNELVWNGYTKLDRKNRGIIYPSKGNRKCLVKLRNVLLIRKSSSVRS